MTTSVRSSICTRKGHAQARVSTDIFHDGLRRETCSDTRITLAQYRIILAVHSVHFANFLRGILRCGLNKLSWYPACLS